MNHVSVSPTDGNGPTQGQRKTLTKVGIEPTTFGLDLRHATLGNRVFRLTIQMWIKEMRPVPYGKVVHYKSRYAPPTEQQKRVNF